VAEENFQPLRPSSSPSTDSFGKMRRPKSEILEKFCQSITKQPSSPSPPNSLLFLSSSPIKRQKIFFPWVPIAAAKSDLVGVMPHYLHEIPGGDRIDARTGVKNWLFRGESLRAIGFGFVVHVHVGGDERRADAESRS